MNYRSVSVRLCGGVPLLRLGDLSMVIVLRMPFYTVISMMLYKEKLILCRREYQLIVYWSFDSPFFTEAIVWNPDSVSLSS